MGFWSIAKRVGEGVATGGLSEGYRAATGGRDPLDDLESVPGKVWDGAKWVGGKIENALGVNPTDTTALDADIAATKGLQPTIAGAYPGDRAAPQIGAAPTARAPLGAGGGFSVPGMAGGGGSPQGDNHLLPRMQATTQPAAALSQGFGERATQQYRDSPQSSGGGGLLTVTAPTVAARTAAAPGQVSTSPVNAQQATTALTGPAATATAQQGAATTTQGATINTAPSNEVRADQRSLVGNLQGVIAGTAPSVAAEQYRGSLADIADRGAAAVAGATGSQRAAMKRSALYSTADATQKSARDLALIRAQESATGRQQLGGVLEGTRGQDVGLATSQAGLNQGANLQNAQLITDVSSRNAALGTGVSQSNAASANDLNKFNAGETNNTSQFNAGQGNQVAEANATNKIGVDTGNANRNLSGDQFNSGQVNDMTKFGAGQNLEAQKANASQELQRQIQNVDAQLRARGMDDASREAYIKNLLAQNQQVLSSDLGKIGISQADAAGKRQFLGGLISAAGTYAAA